MRERRECMNVGQYCSSAKHTAGDRTRGNCQRSSRERDIARERGSFSAALGVASDVQQLQSLRLELEQEQRNQRNSRGEGERNYGSA